ncbi:MAG: 50S ribosomal protein L19e [Candidatus Micrarchaeales archaeon]
MSIKITKRTAAKLLKRGISSIRIKDAGLEDADKAITREDVRRLISAGNVYAQVEKHNVSVYGKLMKEKRAQGRRRGSGRKKGTLKARGSVEHKKRIRAQRRVLIKLKEDKVINNELFKGFYRLVRGGTFVSKASLLGHIRSHGVTLTEEKFKELKHI